MSAGGIAVDFDLRQLFKVFGDTKDPRAKRKMAYAVVNGINAATLRVQREARRNVAERFTLRSDRTSRFIEREAAIIKPKASVREARPYADISVGQKPRLLLPEFERGALRRPFTPGAKRVAVPITGTAARPTLGSQVPAALRFRSLRLRPQVSAVTAKRIRESSRVRGDRSASARNRRALTSFVGGVVPWKGRERTYMLPELGVFKRTGPGRRQSQMIYFFASDVRLPPSLHFLETAKAAAQFFLRDEIEHAVVLELAGEGRALF